MKTITIIAGTHGAGKTSFLGVMKGILEYVPDIIDEDIMVYDTKEPLQVLKKQEIGNLIFNEINWDLPITLKTTLFPDLIPVLQLSRTMGYRIEMHYIALSSLEECTKRVENRFDNGLRNIPVSEIKECFEHRWEVLSDMLPLCDEIVFYDNDFGFRPVGRWLMGKFAPFFFGKLPPWWEEMRDYYLEKTGG